MPARLSAAARGQGGGRDGRGHRPQCLPDPRGTRDLANAIAGQSGAADERFLERPRRQSGLVQPDPGAIGRYRNAFSGGQRQRSGIARALAMEPELLIADEPVRTLDVSVQVPDLLADIRARPGLAMLFITHDLRIAAQMRGRIAVMQRGAIVDQRPTAGVFGNPQHAYTRQVLGSIPGRAWVPPVIAAGGDDP